MKVTPGATDVTTYFSLVLASDGSDATGLTIGDLDLQYVRSGVAPVAKVDATALAATDSAHSDNKAIEIDATDQPGLYRVDWPDAAFAAGVREVVLTVRHASCRAAHLRVELETVQTGDSYAITSSGAHGNAALKTLIDTIDDLLDTEVAAIKAKTDNLPSDPADASDIAAAIAALNDLSAAEVNAEVVDALATDTYTELGGVPGFPASVTTMIRRMYNTAVNGLTVTSSKKQYLSSAGAAVWEKDLSDDTTTYAETAGNAP